MHTVRYPDVPGVVPVHEQLRPGCVINIHGKVDERGYKNFAVEFLSGPNVVLHINFRFHCNENEVVMNSCNDGNWGQEIPSYNPLHRGDRFNIQICVQHDNYEIQVNGQHLAYYSHRFPMESVQAIGIKGDVFIDRIEFTGFEFRTDWNQDYHYGHSGYYGYGTVCYLPPVEIDD
ncbi:unnamed protein product [Cylicocyclus nassatus]|uniref:Galectin n=1 Tax=Cylicocyclus nassatus TaxID=53992 RepID=A0AA36MHE1_CYLNA|nr:unnamed protein product [Cylicocyclus nassatus]